MLSISAAEAAHVARAQPGPISEMGCRDKPGHVYADFGDDRRGGHLTNARDLFQKSPLHGERDQGGLDLAIEASVAFALGCRRLLDPALRRAYLAVFPDESYDIVFVADDLGIWMRHCHNMVHARYGMMLMVMYDHVMTSYKDGGPAGNVSD